MALTFHAYIERKYLDQGRFKLSACDKRIPPTNKPKTMTIILLQLNLYHKRSMLFMSISINLENLKKVYLRACEQFQ